MPGASSSSDASRLLWDCGTPHAASQVTTIRVATNGEGHANPNGDCTHSEHRIRVETRNTPAQRVKTLAHEIAHALLHEQFDSRALAELEAESTAYVVCQSLGLDSSDYSFGYVATWAGGGEQAIAGIKASCERIQRTAATILRAFEPAA